MVQWLRPWTSNAGVTDSLADLVTQIPYDMKDSVTEMFDTKLLYNTIDCVLPVICTGFAAQDKMLNEDSLNPYI